MLRSNIYPMTHPKKLSNIVLHFLMFSGFTAGSCKIALFEFLLDFLANILSYNHIAERTGSHKTFRNYF